MLNNKEVYKRHPELLELREFKSDEEITAHFKNGGTMWEVWGSVDGAGGIDGPTEVTGIGIYNGECSILWGKPIYTGEENEDWGFIESLQNSPQKAVFTSKERAEVFFEAVRQARASDPEWQADELAEKESWKDYEEEN